MRNEIRKYTSVFGLCARASLFNIILLSVLTAVAEGVLFWLRMKNNVLPLFANGLNLPVPQLEKVISESFLPFAFAIGFVVITLTLTELGCEKNTKSLYTFQRLSITERGFFYCQSIYNAMAYFIFWSVQVAALYIICLYYTNSVPSEYIGNQTVFLAFYRSDFLHSVLPMSEISVWIRNIILIIGLAFSAAEYPFKQRRKKFGATVFGLGIYAGIFFCTEFGTGINTFFMIIFSLGCMAEAIYCIHSNWNVEV